MILDGRGEVDASDGGSVADNAPIVDADHDEVGEQLHHEQPTMLQFRKSTIMHK